MNSGTVARYNWHHQFVTPLFRLAIRLWGKVRPIVSGAVRGAAASLGLTEPLYRGEPVGVLMGGLCDPQNSSYVQWKRRQTRKREREDAYFLSLLNSQGIPSHTLDSGLIVGCDSKPHKPRMYYSDRSEDLLALEASERAAINDVPLTGRTADMDIWDDVLIDTSTIAAESIESYPAALLGEQRQLSFSFPAIGDPITKELGPRPSPLDCGVSI